MRTQNKSDPLQSWRGFFGEKYVQRNPASAEATAEAGTVFERILETSGIRQEIGSVLEVRANIGINLIGLRQALGPKVRLGALEPNPSACEQLRSRKALNLEEVIETDVNQIPLAGQSYDLVFTNGVLVHVPPTRLAMAMREIARVSGKYVLCSVYFSHLPVEVPYRGRTGMLWKRDFGQAYLEHCPNLKIHQYGFLWQVEFSHFDNLNWWMFKKTLP